jgi:hypothetical protein
MAVIYDASGNEKSVGTSRSDSFHPSWGQDRLGGQVQVNLLGEAGQGRHRLDLAAHTQGVPGRPALGQASTMFHFSGF